MALKLDQGGNFEITYAAPYTGLNVQMPANLLQDSDSPAFSNFTLRNAALQSRPTFAMEFSNPDADPPLGLFSFLDVNGTYHTLCWTDQSLYQLKPVTTRAPGADWAVIAGSGTIQPAVPIAYRAFSNLAYWVNGAPTLSSWDGLAATATANVAVVGKDNFAMGQFSTDVNLGAYFLGELVNHILLANVVASDGTTTGYFPQRLWWSASGEPTVWDPLVNLNAGFNDFLDCPDNITGLATLGIQGYVFRTNGISQFFPTGSGAAPFQFDHMWASNLGVGSVYPWSISQYGPWVCFISTEQIYQIGINTLTPIGGGARDAVITDLANATGTVEATIVGNFVLSYVYYGYLISIPLASGTNHYFYSFEDSNWSLWTTSNQVITGQSNEVWI